MARTTFLSNESLKEIEKRIKEEKLVCMLKKLQAVYFGMLKWKTETISQITGYKEGYIRQLWMEYREKGMGLFVNHKGDARGRAYFSREEEKNLLQPFLDSAEKAGVLIVTPIHQALEKQVGGHIAVQTTYNLLHRHGWRKIAPRPSHPKRDSIKREAFLSSFPPESAKS